MSDNVIQPILSSDISISKCFDKISISTCILIVMLRLMWLEWVPVLPTFWHLKSCPKVLLYMIFIVTFWNKRNFRQKPVAWVLCTSAATVSTTHVNVVTQEAVWGFVLHNFDSSGSCRNNYSLNVAWRGDKDREWKHLQEEQERDELLMSGFCDRDANNPLQSGRL